MSYLLTPNGRKNILNEEKDPHEETAKHVHDLHHLGKVDDALQNLHDHSLYYKMDPDKHMHDKAEKISKALSKHPMTSHLKNTIKHHAKDKTSAVHDFIFGVHHSSAAHSEIKKHFPKETDS